MATSRAAQRSREATAICEAMTRLHGEHTGREPVKARTAFSRHQVTCVLEGILTAGEREFAHRASLSADRVLGQHRQALTHPEAIREVERITARPVLECVSDDHADPDRAVITWVLGPEQWDLALERGVDPGQSLDRSLAKALRLVKRTGPAG